MWRIALLPVVIALSLPPGLHCGYRKECENICFGQSIDVGREVLTVACTKDYLLSVTHTVGVDLADWVYSEYECSYQNGTAYIGPVKIGSRNIANVNVSSQSDNANTFCTVRGCYENAAQKCEYYPAVSDYCRQNECITGNHNCEHAECTDTPESFVCGNCSQGFTGYGVNCTDIDECSLDLHNCSLVPNSTCDNTVGGFDCVCNAGFTKDGETCINVNECEDQPCHPNATCYDTEGSFTCVCNPGYVGNGTHCSYDECEDQPCHPNATCEDTHEGSFTCTCKPGYVGNGTHCSYDECEDQPCHPNATCEDTHEGNFTCTCKPGYTGNGILCSYIPPSVTLGPSVTPNPSVTSGPSVPPTETEGVKVSVIAVSAAVLLFMITAIVPVVLCIALTRRRARRLQEEKAFSGVYNGEEKLPIDPLLKTCSFISLMSVIDPLTFEPDVDSDKQRELLTDAKRLFIKLNHHPSSTSEILQHENTTTDQYAAQNSTPSSPTDTVSPQEHPVNREELKCRPTPSPQHDGSESSDYIYSHSSTAYSGASVFPQSTISQENSNIDEIELDLLDGLSNYGSDINSEGCIQGNIQTFMGTDENNCGIQTSSVCDNKDDCGSVTNPLHSLAKISEESLSEEHTMASTEKPLHSKEFHRIPLHVEKEGNTWEESGISQCNINQMMSTVNTSLTECISKSNTTSGSSLGYSSLQEDYELSESLSQLASPTLCATQNLSTGNCVTDSNAPDFSQEDLDSSTSYLMDSSSMFPSPCSNSSNTTSGSSVGYMSLEDYKLLESFSQVAPPKHCAMQDLSTSGYVTDSNAPKLPCGFHEDLDSSTSTRTLVDPSSTLPTSLHSLDDISMQGDFTLEDGNDIHLCTLDGTHSGCTGMP